MSAEVIAGRYELEELVGSGGMSTVYRAHDRLLERKVALKILHAQHVEDAEYVERFRREARAVAQLAHPNIVTVIDRGDDEGRQFIVFEYVDGDDLKQLVSARGALPIPEVLALGLQIAQALAFAHERGIVHRDVKPQNVLLNGDGRAKVTDFGIARSLDVEKGFTQTGTVLGTSSYIAPEQATGQPVDERSDVYSLGVVLYELVTGELPFPGESFVAVAMQHVNEPPPDVRERRGDVPPRLAELIDRMLAKDHRDRPSSQEVVDELRSLQVRPRPATAADATQVSRAPRKRPARRSRPWPLILAGLGALLLGAAFGALILRDDDGAGTAEPPAGAAAKVTAVRAIDPSGDGEHGEAVANATDGDGATYWPTERYDLPNGELGKPGVGLELRATGTPKELVVNTETPGFTAAILSGEQIVSPAQTVNDGTAFALPDDARGPFTFWITNRGPNGSVRVNELAAR